MSEAILILLKQHLSRVFSGKFKHLNWLITTTKDQRAINIYGPNRSVTDQSKDLLCVITKGDSSLSVKRGSLNDQQEEILTEILNSWLSKEVSFS